MQLSDTSNKGDTKNIKGTKIEFRLICFFTAICMLLVSVLYLLINNFYITNTYSEMSSKRHLSKSDSSIDEKTKMNQISMQQFEIIIDRLNNEKKQLEKGVEDLQRELEKLEEENIKLQNSLRIAASAGIKPQNYRESRPVESSRGAHERWEYLGKFKGTAYTPSVEECGNNKGITSSGLPIIPGVSVAIDTNYWPYGTIFYISGIGYVVAMDRGSAIKGEKRFDIAVFDKNFAKNLGSKLWDVYLVKKGEGKVEFIDL